MKDSKADEMHETNRWSKERKKIEEKRHCQKPRRQLRRTLGLPTVPLFSNLNSLWAPSLSLEKVKKRGRPIDGARRERRLKKRDTAKSQGANSGER